MRMQATLDESWTEVEAESPAKMLSKFDISAFACVCVPALCAPAEYGAVTAVSTDGCQSVRQKLRARTEILLAPLVETVPLVGFFCQDFPICWFIRIPLVGMCHRVVYMYTHVP